MDTLIDIIEEQKKSKVRFLVDKRAGEFEGSFNKSENGIFLELCFCLLTANFNAKRTIEIHTRIGDRFLTLKEVELAKLLKKVGYRFPNTRAKYILEARKYKKELFQILKTSKNEDEIREWLVENIKGLGYKESSHFLRNIGFKNFAILDFHVIDVLEKHGIVRDPKPLNKKRYLKIEEKLREIGKKTDLNMEKLDLYLFYLETGQVLK